VNFFKKTLIGIGMALIDFAAIEKEARETVNKELVEKATKSFATALRKLEAAKQVVRNVEAEIEDLKASITDGSFNRT
jgi:hypothetical protein